VPLRDKRQAVQVVAYASDRRNRQLSALGEVYNRQLMLSDLRHLLGDDYPEGVPSAGALLEAALTTAGPGHADAIARLGGPFVRFVELTTPEEAGQCFGRIIVGGPVDKTKPYTLSATFALDRAGQSERRTVEIAGSTDAQIVNVPFALGGIVQTAQWSAEVKLTWQGHTLTSTHTSRVLFPTITAWHAVVYHREKTPITLAQIVDNRGNLNKTQGWEDFVQTWKGLRSVTDMNVVFLARNHREQLRAGEPLAAYVVTTITSPDDREAVLRFGGGGEITFYLNGQAIDVVDEDEERPLPRFRETRRTECLRLCKGKNVLVVHTQPQARARFWALGGAFMAPDGTIMTDLVFA
jgi:hypothetical protein